MTINKSSKNLIIAVVILIPLALFLFQDYIIIYSKGDRIQNEAINLSIIDKNLLDCPRHIIFDNKMSLPLKIFFNHDCGFYSIMTNDIFIYCNDYGSLYHELGHCIWYTKMIEREREIYSQIYDDSLIFPTKYSKTEPEEDFAESFMCYFIDTRCNTLTANRINAIKAALEGIG